MTAPTVTREGVPALVVLDTLEQAEALTGRPMAVPADLWFVEGVVAALRWVTGNGAAPDLPVPADTCRSCDGSARREGPGGIALVCEDCVEGVAR